MGTPADEGSTRLLTRRRALGLLGAVGATAVAGSNAASRGETTIATVVARDRPLRTASVPTDWYDRERRARAALRVARSRYAGLSAVVDVTLGTAGERVAGRPTSSIDVYVERGSDHPGADLGGGLPEPVGEVASRLVEVPTPALLDDADPPAGGSADPDPPERPTSRDRTDHDQGDPGPAGDATERAADLRVGGGATLRTRPGTTASATCGATWRGDRHLLTCAHLFAGRDGRCDRVDGRVVLDATGRRIGRVARSDPAQDWALVEAADGVRFDDSIAGVPGTVCGRVTTAGLHLLKSQGVEVRKTGQATPERRGPIRAVGVRHGGCDLGDGLAGRRYVDVDVPSVPGDSGGPVYHEFEYGGRRLLAMVGVVAARVGCTRASGVDAIHRDHGVSFALRSPLPL